MRSNPRRSQEAVISTIVTNHLITGLPRSRSAWLSVVLGGVHDPEDGVYELVCDPSVACGHKKTRVLGKTVFVYRNVGDSERAVVAAMRRPLHEPAWLAMVASADMYKSKADKVVFYEDLDSSETVRDLGRFLGVDVSLENIERLQKLTITQDFDKCRVQ